MTLVKEPIRWTMNELKNINSELKRLTELFKDQFLLDNNTLTVQHAHLDHTLQQERAATKSLHIRKLDKLFSRRKRGQHSILQEDFTTLTLILALAYWQEDLTTLTLTMANRQEDLTTLTLILAYWQEDLTTPSQREKYCIKLSF